MDGGNLVIVEEDFSEDEDLEVFAIKDKKFRSKARSTLPDVLSVVQTDTYICGVVAKTRIRARTQFGPLDAPLISEQVSSFVLKPGPTRLNEVNTADDKSDLYYDTREENACNWMCLVRVAQNSDEQNLVAQLVKQDVYFTTIRKIEAKEELKVWYAPKYAKFLSKPLLLPNINQHEDNEARSLRGRKLRKTIRASFNDPIRDDEEVDVRSVPPKKRNWGRTSRQFVKSSGILNHIESVRNISQENRDIQPTPISDPTSAPPDVLDTAIELIMEVEKTKVKNRHVCYYCGKSFGRKHTLKLHQTSHFPPSFLCHTCGRPFKRKDKLHEHIKRMHTAGVVAKVRKIKQTGKTFQPQISPTDYQRFLYKCMHCMVGFQRRGMLVNHLLKRHPEVNVNAVPELRLPIMKKTVAYVCPYCSKSYQSITKRKDHILKHHPGQQVPPGLREVRKANCAGNIIDPAIKKTPTVTAQPVNCPYCPSQYSGRAKMVNHLTVKHPDKVGDYVGKKKRPSTKKVDKVDAIPTYQHNDNEFDNPPDADIHNVNSYLEHDILAQVDSTMAPENQYIVGRQMQPLQHMPRLPAPPPQPEYLPSTINVTIPTDYDNQYITNTVDDVTSNVTTDILSEFENAVRTEIHGNTNENYRVLNNQLPHHPTQQHNTRQLPMTYQRGRKQLLLQAMNEERDRDNMNRQTRNYHNQLMNPHSRDIQTDQSHSSMSIQVDDITMDINRTNTTDYLHNNHLNNQHSTTLTQLSTPTDGWICPSYVIIPSDKQKPETLEH